MFKIISSRAGTGEKLHFVEFCKELSHLHCSLVRHCAIKATVCTRSTDVSHSLHFVVSHAAPHCIQSINSPHDCFL
jgi:hypothetical protein